MKLPSQEYSYKTILVFMAGMIGFHFLLKSDTPLFLAAGLGLISVALPISARVFTWAWTLLGKALGYVNSRILLTIMFYLGLVPIAFFYKLRNKDAMMIAEKERSTLYSERNHTFVPKDLENLF